MGTSEYEDFKDEPEPAKYLFSKLRPHGINVAREDDDKNRGKRKPN